MTVDKNKALCAAFKEAGIQLLQEVPLFSSLIEGVRKYHEDIEDQQREKFIQELVERQESLAKNAAWYSTDAAAEFVKKVVATSLNAEYADKLKFLANALANGPSLGNDDARRMKFVELIRQVSCPALEVLVASVRLTADGDIIVDRIAECLQWHPALVEACVRELHSLGAYSHIVRWENRDGQYRAMASFMNEKPGVAPLTREFAGFIQEGHSEPAP